MTDFETKYRDLVAGLGAEIRAAFAAGFDLGCDHPLLSRRDYKARVEGWVVSRALLASSERPTPSVRSDGISDPSPAETSGGGVGTGASGENDPGHASGEEATVWVNRSVDTPEAPAQAHTSPAPLRCAWCISDAIGSAVWSDGTRYPSCLLPEHGWEQRKEPTMADSSPAEREGEGWGRDAERDAIADWLDRCAETDAKAEQPDDGVRMMRAVAESLRENDHREGVAAPAPVSSGEAGEHEWWDGDHDRPADAYTPPERAYCRRCGGGRSFQEGLACRPQPSRGIRTPRPAPVVTPSTEGGDQ